MCVVSLEEVDITPGTVPFSQCRELRTEGIGGTKRLDNIIIPASTAIGRFNVNQRDDGWIYVHMLICQSVPFKGVILHCLPSMQMIFIVCLFITYFS